MKFVPFLAYSMLACISLTAEPTLEQQGTPFLMLSEVGESNQLAAPYLYEAKAVNLDAKTKLVVQHVQSSIRKADKGISKLDTSVLTLEGMSSAKNRHLLNNLCNRPHTRYLEIGVWMGSTWVAALYDNKENIEDAIAIDNWSKFGGPRDKFFENCQKYLPGYNYRVYSEDSFRLDLASSFHSQLPINVYFYDGDHSALSQELALTYYDSVLDNVYILVVDDWNREEIRQGTFSALRKLKYDIAYQVSLPSSKINDYHTWWNGLYVAVIRKK